MSLNLRCAFCILVIIVFGTLSQAPEGVCRSPFEDIIAGYNRNLVVLQGNLTYSTEDWHFNIPKQLMFNLTIDVPANTTADVNVTRLLLFLEFLDEDPDLNRVILVNETELPQTSYESTAVILNETYFVAIYEDEVAFIPEWSNWVVLGFLVSLDLKITGDTINEQLNGINIYSHEPESVDWSWSPGMFILDNEDRFWLYGYSEYISPNMELALLFVFGLFLFVCGVPQYLDSDLRKRRKASNLKNYIKKKTEIHGKYYSLDGVRITLAYYMWLVLPNASDNFGVVVSEWARSRADLEIAHDLDPAGLPKEKEPIWFGLRKALSWNALQVDIYLYEQFPRGTRAAEIIGQLRRHKLQVSEYVASWIEMNIDQEVEEEYMRREPSGELFSKMRTYVEKHLELIVPNELSQLRGALVQLEERRDLDVFAAVTLSCREIHQSLVYALVTAQVLSNGSPKPSQSMSRDSMEKIVGWLRKQLKGSAEEPLALIEKGFSMFEEYAKSLDRLIQRDVHKDKEKLKMQEVIGHVTTLYSMMNELLILLDRAGFDWSAVE